MRKKVSIILICIMIVVLFVGCSQKKQEVKMENYNGRTFYEIFVRSFKDSNGDGIGDLNGVTEKLDYLKELGVKGIWLMPINDSPSYHGYDVTDYYKINPQYGTMEDFKKLLEEAHKRDIKVLMDMVLNHTSSENQWFKEAKADKASKYRDYYIWTQDENIAAQVSPMGTMPWIKNGENDEYYYAIFWEGMPDLNYDNKAVRDEVKNISKYYIDMGVDGFRLDAAKWIYNSTEKNIDFWKEYNEYCKSLNKNFVLVGEVWDNLFAMAPYQTVLDSFFDFPVGDYVTQGINYKSISDIPSQVKDNYETLTEQNKEFIPSPFLTNHDQERIMNKLDDVEKMKMAATIYLSLPGTPFIYYGEEIGMKGTKPDEMIREPFIWDNKDKKENTSWEAITNDIDKIAVSVEKEDENSLYNFYKKLLAVRNSEKAMMFGTVDKVDTSSDGIMNMKRTFQNENIFVIINSNSSEDKTPLPKGKYEVLLCNKDQKKSLKSDGNVELKAGEILIIKEK